jgi:hypothetical protein
MLKRKLTIAAALAAALLAPAMASATADGWRYVGGEAGWVFVMPEPSRLTREEVQRAPTEPLVGVWRYVGGEAGWIAEVHRLTYKQGQLVHADDCLVHASSATPARDSGPDTRELTLGA